MTLSGPGKSVTHSRTDTPGLGPHVGVVASAGQTVFHFMEELQLYVNRPQTLAPQGSPLQHPSKIEKVPTLLANSYQF
jgi:hypothetical protein